MFWYGRFAATGAGQSAGSVGPKDNVGLHDQVAEFATSNIMIVKDDTVRTSVPDGKFLAGITRSRVIKLLRWAAKKIRTPISQAIFVSRGRR
jgi:hypothetical protein